MQQFRVERTEAEKFAKIWHKGGIVVPMQDVHIDFATAFANVVLNNFVQMCKAQVTNTQQAAPAPEPEKKLILAA